MSITSLISQPIAGMYNIFIGNFTNFDFYKTFIQMLSV
jgi:hypothetical protein